MACINLDLKWKYIDDTKILYLTNIIKLGDISQLEILMRLIRQLLRVTYIKGYTDYSDTNIDKLEYRKQSIRSKSI
jgi:hypothetical protein